MLSELEWLVVFNWKQFILRQCRHYASVHNLLALALCEHLVVEHVKNGWIIETFTALLIDNSFNSLVQCCIKLWVSYTSDTVSINDMTDIS